VIPNTVSQSIRSSRSGAAAGWATQPPRTAFERTRTHGTPSNRLDRGNRYVALRSCRPALGRRCRASLSRSQPSARRDRAQRKSTRRGCRRLTCGTGPEAVTRSGSRRASPSLRCGQESAHAVALDAFLDPWRLRRGLNGPRRMLPLMPWPRSTNSSRPKTALLRGRISGEAGTRPATPRPEPGSAALADG
jgi:hypothetical protein